MIPLSQSSVMFGFTQVLTGTCHLRCPYVFLPANEAKFHSETMSAQVASAVLRRQSNDIPTIISAHRRSVITGFSVVSQLMLGDQVVSIERAGF